MSKRLRKRRIRWQRGRHLKRFQEGNAMHRYALALLIVASPFSAFAAELPKEGSYDYTACWSGINSQIAFLKSLLGIKLGPDGLHPNQPAGGTFDKNTFRC